MKANPEWWSQQWVTAVFVELRGPSGVCRFLSGPLWSEDGQLDSHDKYDISYCPGLLPVVTGVISTNWKNSQLFIFHLFPYVIFQKLKRMKSQFESHGNLLFSFFIKYIFIISTIFNFQGSDNPSKHLRSPLNSNEERNSRLALQWFKNITFPILVWSKVDAVFIYWQLDWKLQIQYDRCKASGNSCAKLNYFVEEIFNWNFSFYRPEFQEFVLHYCQQNGSESSW